jgi:hypothetical protein
LNFSASKVPGLASIVISALISSGSSVRTSDSRRSSAAADIRLGVPPPMNTVWILRPQISGSDCSRSARSASR